MIIFAIGNKSYNLALTKFPRHKNQIFKLDADSITNAKNAFSPDLIQQTPIMVFGLAGSNILPIGTEVYVTENYILSSTSASQFTSKLEKPTLAHAPQLGVSCYTSKSFVTSTDIKSPVIFDRALAFLIKDGFKIISSWRIVSDNLSIKQLNDFKKLNQQK